MRPFLQNCLGILAVIIGLGIFLNLIGCTTNRYAGCSANNAEANNIERGYQPPVVVSPPQPQFVQPRQVTQHPVQQSNYTALQRGVRQHVVTQIDSIMWSGGRPGSGYPFCPLRGPNGKAVAVVSGISPNLSFSGVKPPPGKPIVYGNVTVNHFGKLTKMDVIVWQVAREGLAR